MLQYVPSILETHDGEQSHGEGQAQTNRDTATAGRDDRPVSRRDETASADGSEAGDGRRIASARALNNGNSSLCGDDTNSAGICGEADLRHRQSRADNDSGAGVGDDLASIISARHNRRGIDSDSGENGYNRRRSSSDRDVLGDVATSGNSRVLGHVRSTDALEEDNGLRDNGITLTVSINALEHVLDEDGIGAIAVRLGIILAANGEQEGVEASGHNRRARESLDGAVAGGGASARADRSRESAASRRARGTGSARGGSTRRTRSTRSTRSARSTRSTRSTRSARSARNRRSGRQHRCEGLSDRADGCRDSNRHDSGSDATVARAVGNGGSAAGNGRHDSGEDG